MTRRLTIIAAAALLALTGCAKKAPAPAATADTVLTPTATATAPSTTAPTTAPASPPKGSPTKPPTGPAILFLKVKTKPSCPSSGPGASFPGNDVVLEWSAVNVTNVTISIDGPGLFGTYDATSSQSLPFACGTDPAVYKHTYTLRTVGGGTEQKQSITVEARKN